MSTPVKRKLIKILSPMPYSVKRLVYWIWCRTTATGRIANRGERVAVSSWDELVGCGEFYHVMHAHRYWWAAQQIKPKSTKLLDLGCGSGYGTAYLSSTGNFVIGYDPDPDAIEWAKKHFQGDFRASKDWEKNNFKFDVICCFEVIEHDPSNVTSTVLDCLSDNGLLLISTANGSKQSVRQQLIDNKLTTVNPTHVKEFTAKEFKKLLRKHFAGVEMYGQCVKGVYSFKGWCDWRRKSNVKLEDFEMRKDDFVNCEVIVAKCRK